MQNAIQSGAALKPNLPGPQGSLNGYGGQFKVSGFTGAGDVSFGGLNYSISAGNGEYGFGFGSAGGGGISRSTHRNTPTFDDDLDSFELAGSLLVPFLDDTSGARVVKYGTLTEEVMTLADGVTTQTWITPLVSDSQWGKSYNVRQYLSRTEGSYAQIYYWKYNGTAPKGSPSSFWQVIAADNSVSFFGVSDSAKEGDRNDDGTVNIDKVCTWLTEEHLDAAGHCSLTKYLQEDSSGVDITADPEKNHTHHNKIYLDRICSGHATPLPASLSLTLASGLDTSAGYEPGWFFETVWDYGQYDVYDLANQDIYTPANTWSKRLDSHSTYVDGFEIRTHRLCHNVLEFHRFPDEFGTDTPLLHSVTSYFYDESELRTLLVASHQAGYYWNGTGYDTKYTTPVEMEYAEFDPKPGDTERPYREVLKKNSGQPLTSLGSAETFIPVDLYGEGIDGMLASDGGEAYFYQTDWDSIDGKLDSDEPVYYTRSSNPVQLPFNQLREDGGHQLMDINGNGQLDYVTHYAGQLGYFEAQHNEHVNTTGEPINAWDDFEPVPLTPAELAHPHRFFADLTGNKIVDCVLPLKMNGKATVRYYKNNGAEGFEPAQEIANNYMEADVTSFTSSEKIFIGFTGIAGDGKSHLVRMDEQSLVYYPNIGYGEFGKPITMGNFPAFDTDEFRVSRIHFADLDGSGTADLVVAKRDHMEIYLNQCGNRFAETPVTIAYPEGATYNDHTNSLLFTDVFGNGLTCMIFREMGYDAKQWVYDFNGGMKPYLMTKHINNTGATTETTYRSSVHFYLEDKADGLQWFTRAPFPVWSVYEVKVTDAINNSILSETYRYRHSYYDGVEKTFRGYGYAEHIDVIESYNAEDMLDSPPSKSCVWYDSGNPDQETINRLYESLEYFMAGEQSTETGQKDSNARYVPTFNADYGSGSSSDELERQAHLHLAGTPLRSEIYGKQTLASTDWELYSAGMSNELVLMVQDMADTAKVTTLPLLNYASFEVRSRESLGYHYERNLADPMVGYTAALTFDDYGHVLQHCIIQYPRRSGYSDSNADVTQEQQTLRCATSLNVVQSFRDPGTDLGIGFADEQFYLLGVPTQETNYHVCNPKDIGPLDGETGSAGNVFTAYSGGIYTYEDVQAFLQTTNTNEMAPAFNTSAEMDLISLVEQTYFYVQPNTITDEPAPDCLTGLYQNEDDEGTVTALNRPGHRGFLLVNGVSHAVFEKDGLETALVGANFFSSAELTPLMEDTGKYLSLSYTMNKEGADTTTDFWSTNPGIFVYGGAAQFYALQSSSDPMGNTSTTTYDRYNLVVVESTDALGNISKIPELNSTYSDGTNQRAIDYQLLHPFRTTDLNNNSSEVVFDALGRVVASSHYGTCMKWDEESSTFVETSEGFGKLYTGGSAGRVYSVTPPASAAEVIANPMTYLSDTAGFMFYQPFSWMGQVSMTTLNDCTGDEWCLQLQQQGLMNGEGALFSRLYALLESSDSSAFFAGLTELGVDSSSFQSDEKEDVWGVFSDAAASSRIPVHILTTAIKDYPDATNARVTKTQLLALGEAATDVDDWFTQAYAAGYLLEETGANNGQSTYGIYTPNLRSALEACGDAASFATALGTKNSLLKTAFKAFKNQDAVFALYKQGLDERIEQSLQYSDGLGRSVQSKIKAESGAEYFIYDAEAGTVTSNATGNATYPRWLTQGQVVYNNKGQVVLAYDPYYIDTASFIADDLLRKSGTSPVNYYDGLGRVTHSITPKGYMTAQERTTWSQTTWDTNDCLYLSPYFQVNRQFFDGSENPAAVPGLDSYYFDYSDEKLDTGSSNYNAEVAQSVITTIQHSMKLGFSPDFSVHDNRGLEHRSRQVSGADIISDSLYIEGITSDASTDYSALLSTGMLEERTMGDQMQAGQEVILSTGIRTVLAMGDQTQTLLLSTGTTFSITLSEVTLYDETAYTPTEASTVSVSSYAVSGTTRTLFLLWETGVSLPKQLMEGSTVPHADGTPVHLVTDAAVTLDTALSIAEGTTFLLQSGQEVSLSDGTPVSLSATTQVTAYGDETASEFRVEPYEVWAEMADAYPALVINIFQQLAAGLDQSYALRLPAILFMVWYADVSATTLTATTLQTLVTDNFAADCWYFADYDALVTALQTGGWIDSSGTVNAEKITYPTLNDDENYNKQLNAALMLTWAQGKVFETSYAYDEYGRSTRIADPRFTESNDNTGIVLGDTNALHNQDTAYIGSIGGAVTTAYCDAGQSWALPDVQGRHLWSRDARGVEKKVTYDALNRPLDIIQTFEVSFSEALGQWSSTVLRTAYGESVTDADKYNFRGQAAQSVTQGVWSGASQGFNILGLPLGSSLMFTKQYAPAGSSYDVPEPCVNFDNVSLTADEVLKTNTLSSDLGALLQTSVYENEALFDAAGEIQRSIDVAQNIHIPNFYLSGGVGQIKVNGINFMDEVVYNARKQKLSVKTKNSSDTLVTQNHYTYDPKNYGLLQMYASHSDSDVSRTNEHELIYNGITGTHEDTRQNLVYTFDPMANVAAVPARLYQAPDAVDTSTTHTFKSSAQYEYDGLYRLIKAEESE